MQSKLIMLQVEEAVKFQNYLHMLQVNREFIESEFFRSTCNHQFIYEASVGMFSCARKLADLFDSNGVTVDQFIQGKFIVYVPENEPKGLVN